MNTFFIGIAIGGFIGGFVAPFFAPWLRRQPWFDAMTSRIAHLIDRAAGY